MTVMGVHLDLVAWAFWAAVIIIAAFTGAAGALLWGLRGCPHPRNPSVAECLDCGEDVYNICPSSPMRGGTG